MNHWCLTEPICVQLRDCASLSINHVKSVAVQFQEIVEESAVSLEAD